MSRLMELYKKTIVPKMKEEFGFTNVMQVPRLVKVVINIGIGESLQKPQLTDQIIKDLAIITGQKPVINKARKSIAGFKIRTGDKVGLSVTLHGKKMYDFVERLVSIALPRIRDFRGLPTKAFDGQGNYSLGLKEQIVFPEIPYDTADYIHGLQINIATTAKNNEEARALLTQLGFPFQKES